MAAPTRRNIFEAFDDGDQIYTQDSDIEPDSFESDDEDPDFTDDDSDSSDDDPQPGPSTKRRRLVPVASSTQSSDSDSSDNEEFDDCGWNRILNDYPSIPAFTGTPRLHFHNNANPTTPLDFFQLIINKDMLNTIKQETNRYARTEIERIGDDAKPNSIYRLWKPATMTDIRGMFTILSHMAIVDKPTLALYWSTSDVVRCEFPGKILSRDRFSAILSFLHLSNNETYIPRDQPNHDPLHKICPFFDHLRTIFPALYTPTKKVSIDEAICPWRGKLRFRVYMKDKPSKWGIKLYELCESESGYVTDLEIYAANPAISNRPTDVCLRMMEPYLDKGYWLYTDNYYTCPQLSDALQARGTMTIGTVRSNRVGMPKGLGNQTIARGDSDYRVKNGLCVIRWMDKKGVNILSTVHNPLASEPVTTRTGTKVKPSAVQDYTLNMAGFDHSDQMMSYAPLRRRTQKWWKKLFMHLLSLVYVQAHILYKKKTKSTVSMTQFLISLTEEMATDYGNHRAEVQRKRCVAQGNDLPPQPATPVPAPSPTSRLGGKYGHYPEPIPPTPSKDKPYRACKVCYRRQTIEKQRNGNGAKSYKRQETRHWCSTCKVALCINPCFQDFHTKKDYL